MGDVGDTYPLIYTKENPIIVDADDADNKLENLNNIFNYIFMNANIEDEHKESFILKFKELNNKTKFELLKNIINGEESKFTEDFIDILNIDERIKMWARDNDIQSNDWKNLLKEIGITTLNSLTTKKKVDTTELFNLLQQKLKSLNKIIQNDRELEGGGISRKKYLKYKQKYLNLKNVN